MELSKVNQKSVPQVMTAGVISVESVAYA